MKKAEGRTSRATVPLLIVSYIENFFYLKSYLHEILFGFLTSKDLVNKYYKNQERYFLGENQTGTLVTVGPSELGQCQLAASAKKARV
jgi:hypothetical protein